ncbi:MAG: hypothetical protein A3K19_06435 [Lentisphaerae bacterium RIFOXYB12_FULL_65_16]|nr:MAG: hypothetical protein A3K18_10000 [Lentisphaerae bacterium RIFOXYA12_64_32]OGV93819.1 MAG: hypothetical protein A3K19_06435 [Lentisphaerae bacterium RIFOXYB12_FULL_65_16]
MAVAGALWLTAGAAWAGKLGLVDMEKVFQGYYKTSRSDSAFQKQKDVYSDHAKNLAAEIDAIKKQRDEQQEKSLNIALSDEVRADNRKGAEEKNGLYQEKKKEFKDFLTKTDKELQGKYLELRSEIVKEITEFLKKYGEREGFDLVLDSSGLTRNFIPVVIYHASSLDVTEAVLGELNKGHEAEVEEAKKKAAETGAAPLQQGGAAAVKDDKE